MCPSHQYAKHGPTTGRLLAGVIMMTLRGLVRRGQDSMVTVMLHCTVDAAFAADSLSVMSLSRVGLRNKPSSL